MNRQNELRIIKKYPNRRLYDTAISSYITVADIKQLVLDRVQFCVQDAKTGEDLTRVVLLQIILEQEERGKPIFSNVLLEEIIRFYGGALQNLAAAYLENSFRLFTEQQDKINAQMQQLLDKTPLGYLQNLTEQHFKLWKDMQDSYFQATLGKANKKSKADTDT